MRTGFTVYFVSALLGALLSAGWMGGDRTRAHGQEPGEKPSAEAHISATAEEPLAKEFSLERAARSLDASALAWQKQSRPWVSVGCSQCHANLMYLIARPLLAESVPPPPDVRAEYESLAELGGGHHDAPAG